jgi:hypothetical protein
VHEGVSHTLRFQILKRDRFTCQYCGAQAPQAKVEVEHIVPPKQGGEKTNPDNLVCSCYDCNRGKSTKLLSDNKLTALTETDLLEARIQRLLSIQLAARDYAEVLQSGADRLDRYWWEVLVNDPSHGFAEPTLALFRDLLRDIPAPRLEELMALAWSNDPNPKRIRPFLRLAWRERNRHDHPLPA